MQVKGPATSRSDRCWRNPPGTRAESAPAEHALRRGSGRCAKRRTAAARASQEVTQSLPCLKGEVPAAQAGVGHCPSWGWRGLHFTWPSVSETFQKPTSPKPTWKKQAFVV